MHISLWRHREFGKLWSGHVISDLGSAIGSVALPLTAVVTLGAGATQMGVLVALEQTPVLLFSLLAGVWVDRLPRRQLIVAAQIGRAVLLATIPVAAVSGVLRIEQLYVVGFLAGTLKLVFDLAATTILPTLIGRRDLIDGNAKLQMSTGVAEASGRVLGGLLVRLVTAPLAIAFDALSFLLSGLLAILIRTAEPDVSQVGADKVGLWREIGEGMRVLVQTPPIRAMTISATVGSFGGAIQQTVFALYLTNELSLGSVWFGIILGILGAAAFVGTFLAGPAARRFGPGPALIVGTFFWTGGAVLLALVSPQMASVLGLLGLAQISSGIGRSIASINQISLRQAITPDHLLGRVNASRRLLVFGVIPFGALLGGALGESFGLRSALFAGAGVQVVGFIYTWLSPLRAVRQQPASSSSGAVPG
ncbi:MAG: MFS transporter [Myxococcota bacterium]